MVKLSSMTSCLNCFPSLWTIGLWNSCIREAVNQGHALKAFFLFRQMIRNGFPPSNFTFPFVAKACSRLSDLKLSLLVHTQVVKSPFSSDKFVQTALLDMYVKCNQLGDAHYVFERMHVRDVASWNSMLVGFAQMGYFDRVLYLFHHMRLAGIRPDSVTIMGLTQAIFPLKNLEVLKAIHSFGIQIGVDADVSVANTWISAYSKCGDLNLAKSIFYGIDSGVRTVVSWNSLIEGYANFEKFLDAFNFYQKMLQGGYVADTSTILSLLSSFVQPEALFHGELIHCHGIQLGCDADIHVVNTLISMYSKCGDIVSARFLFDGMPCRSCVSWTAMISGYVEKGNMNEALGLFHAMEAAGEKPDLVAVLSLISGCGQTSALELGKWVDSYAFSNGLRDNIVVCNALIDMYAKCANIRHAKDLFNFMPEKTVVSWTTIIAGYALNGEFVEALNLFYQMMELGLIPNHVTFLAVLQVCTHAGFLEKGLEFFDMMTKVYNIKPVLDHYSCIVDLLGRKGKVKEALQLVENMPCQPDAKIWGTLLASCKIHRYIEIAEFVSHHLFKLEPHVAAPYVEMANMYASDGKWDRVAAIRTLMKSNKVKKYPGQSVIQVNGKPHVFSVEDRVHPEGSFIYAMLDSFMLKEDEYLVQLKKSLEDELE